MVFRTPSLLREALTKVCWLDLRGAGLSVLERLLLEECLLQKDDRHWVIAGHHEPVRHRYLRESDVTLHHDVSSAQQEQQTSSSRASWDVDTSGRNESAAIVMGIGGKPNLLLNTDLVKDDNVLTLKRFSGGGTVVLDYDSIWTTVIGRRHELVQEHFPRPIMEWTERALFGPMFSLLASKQKLKRSSSDASAAYRKSQQTMVLDTVSCGSENTGRVVAVREIAVNEDGDTGFAEPPFFSLRENDYVLGERKMAGNAQSIGKTGWLHHTSFLWDYQQENMEYLTLPNKRPEYRGDRSHDDFLVKLKNVYPNLAKADFFGALHDACDSVFKVESVALPEAMRVVNAHGGMKGWFNSKSRTKVIHDL